MRSAKTRHNDDLSFDDLISSVIRLLATDGLFEIILPFNESKIFEELATANNLFCITPYKGLDPETDYYTAAYPNAQTYSLGVNVTF